MFWRSLAGMDNLETSLFAAQLVPYSLLAVLAIPFVLYVIARWRAHRDPVADPQLGIKVALSFFMVTAFQLVLAGVTLFCFALISSEPSAAKGTLYRAAFGLIVPAGVVLGAHVGLLARTNQARFPSVRRLFAGYNLLITGVLGFAALVLAFQELFKRGSSHDVGPFAGAAVVVYGVAWVGVGLHLAHTVLGPPGDAPAAGTGSPLAPPPPPRPAEEPSPKGGAGLPALGQGAFPPVDRKP